MFVVSQYCNNLYGALSLGKYDLFKQWHNFSISRHTEQEYWETLYTLSHAFDKDSYLSLERECSHVMEQLTKDTEYVVSKSTLSGFYTTEVIKGILVSTPLSKVFKEASLC